MSGMLVLNFNPRSREGSDLLGGVMVTDPRDFNPRSREGSDRIQIAFGLVFDDISIHAPVKGATIHMVVHGGRIKHFNPRSREGSDAQSGVYKAGRVLISIHAPVKGATRAYTTTWKPHSISIHAPVKGATQPSSQGWS